MRNNFLSTDTFDELEKEYNHRQEKLIPLQYSFLIDFGQVAIRDGHIRRAIELTREALIYADNPDEKAYVYLSLSRMYRMMIQIQNADAELRRGFKVLEIQYPKPGIIPFLIISYAIFLRLSLKKKHHKDSDLEMRKKLLTEMYEEAGLCGYYLRNSELFLLQISLRVRKLVYEIGPSLQMVNYLAATATIFAIFRQTGLASKYLSRAKKVTEVIQEHEAFTKYKTWEVFVHAYNGDAPGSSALIEELLLHEKDYITPYDRRLFCSILTTNYNLCGKTELSLKAIEQMYAPYDYTCNEIFSCNRTFIEWYKIPSLSFHGETKEIERIMTNSRAVFASADGEKYQIVLYLGNILMYYYLSQSRDFDQIKNAFKRFDSIGLSLEQTFLEAQNYWMAKAYLLLELYYYEEAELDVVRSAVADVKKILKPQRDKGHYLILQGHLDRLDGLYSNAYRNIQKAIVHANQIDNEWIFYEAERLAILLAYSEGDKHLATQKYETLRETLSQKKWYGALANLDKLIAKIQ